MRLCFEAVRSWARRAAWRASHSTAVLTTCISVRLTPPVPSFDVLGLCFSS